MTRDEYYRILFRHTSNADMIVLRDKLLRMDSRYGRNDLLNLTILQDTLVSYRDNYYPTWASFDEESSNGYIRSQVGNTNGNWLLINRFKSNGLFDFTSIDLLELTLPFTITILRTSSMPIYLYFCKDTESVTPTGQAGLGAFTLSTNFIELDPYIDLGGRNQYNAISGSSWSKILTEEDYPDFFAELQALDSTQYFTIVIKPAIIMGNRRDVDAPRISTNLHIESGYPYYMETSLNYQSETEGEITLMARWDNS